MFTPSKSDCINENKNQNEEFITSVKPKLTVDLGKIY